MSPARLREDQSPWSFFLPVMFAVAAGMVLSDIVRHVAGNTFANDDAVPVAVAAPPAVSAGLHDEDDLAAPDEAAMVTVGRSSGGDVVLLPGPITAIREGAERACISETIALRRPDGWQQELGENVPLRCRASSP